MIPLNYKAHDIIIIIIIIIFFWFFCWKFWFIIIFSFNLPYNNANTQRFFITFFTIAEMVNYVQWT